MDSADLAVFSYFEFMDSADLAVLSYFELWIVLILLYSRILSYG